MLRRFTDRRERGLVGFLGLAVVLCLALRGLLAGAAPVVHTLEDGRTALCLGSTQFVVDASSETPSVEMELCDEALAMADATLAGAPDVAAPLSPWRRETATTAPRSAALRPHDRGRRARAPPRG